MHKEFANWYRVSVLEPKGETLAARWNAIEKFVAEASTQDALELARVFLGILPKDAGFKEKFASALRAEDAAFPSGRNEVELRVLAGAACAAGIDTQDQSYKFSEMVALAVIAGGCRRRRQRLIMPRIFEVCEQYLRARSAERFEESDKQGDLDGTIKAFKQACTGNNLAQIEKPLGACLDQVGMKLATALDRQRLLQEETNVLWWLYGGHSRDLQIPFTKVEPGALPIVAGKELADLTVYRPGPAAHPEFLKRVLSSQEGRWKGSLADAVDSLPRGWCQSLLDQRSKEEIMDFCPVLAAVRRSIEVKGGKSWVKSAESLLRISLKDRTEPLEIAIQTFLEGILYQYVESNTDGTT